MAIKYYPVPEKRQVVGVLKNCQWDAYNKIDKLLSESNFVFVEPENVKRDKYKMADTYKVIVTCDPRDEYSFEVGAEIAKKRIMEKYYKALDKRMQIFTDSLVDLAHRATMQRCEEFEKKNAKKF